MQIALVGREIVRERNPVRPAERRASDNLYYYYNYNYCPAQFTDGVAARLMREVMAGTVPFSAV